jgi:hypothetical protein
VSDILTAWGTEAALTITGLNSLASSPTAGWSLGYVDNSSLKMLDDWFQFVINPANTAPANDKAFYWFGWGCNNLSFLPSTGASSGGTVGTAGALTFPNITTTPILLRKIYTQLYGVADTPINGDWFSLCRAMDWNDLPKYYGVSCLNYSGAALEASGNYVRHLPQYRTIG